MSNGNFLQSMSCRRHRLFFRQFQISNRYSFVIAVVAVLVGMALLYTWRWGDLTAPILFPGTASVKANTSAVLAACGLALALQSCSSARTSQGLHQFKLAVVILLSAFVLVLGGLTLLQYPTGNDFGIDHLLADATADPAPFPGRMSVPVALAAVLLGLALPTLDWRLRNGHYPAEYAALLVVFVMAVPLTGFLFSNAALVQVASAQRVAPHSPILIIMLACAMLMARPTHRIASLCNSDGPGASLLRRLLPKSIALLILLGLLVDYGAQIGLYTTGMVAPLTVLLSSAWLCILFWRAGMMLNREHEQALRREAALSETSALLQAVSDNTTEAIFVKDASGKLIFANPATAYLIGRNGESLVGLTNAQLYPDPADAAMVDSNDRAVLAQGYPQAMEESLHLDSGLRTLYSTRAPWLNERGEIVGLVGIATDISERKRMEDALRAHETQLEQLVDARTAEVRELIGHLETTREEEKRAIARELHDDLGAALTALSMHLAMLFQKMTPDTALTERALQIKVLLGSVTQITHRIQSGLRPDKLDIFGIKIAIVQQCIEFENYTGISCKADLPDEEIAFAPDTEIALFRMLQESLTNIAKHAKASQVHVTLECHDQKITLRIMDNGVGLPPASSAQTDNRNDQRNDQRTESRITHGLRGMRERVHYLGGEIQIGSEPGKGTAIDIHLPATTVSRPLDEDKTAQAG